METKLKLIFRKLTAKKREGEIHMYTYCKI